MLIKLTYQKVENVVLFSFPAFNNEDEYEAVTFAMKEAWKLGARRIQLYADFKLVEHQSGGSFKAHDDITYAYLSMFKKCAKMFDVILVILWPINDMRHEDLLAFLVVTLNVKGHNTVHMGYFNSPRTDIPPAEFVNISINTYIYLNSAPEQ